MHMSTNRPRYLCAVGQVTGRNNSLHRKGTYVPMYLLIGEVPRCAKWQTRLSFGRKSTTMKTTRGANKGSIKKSKENMNWRAAEILRVCCKCDGGCANMYVPP